MNYYRCSLYVKMKEGQLFTPEETREITQRVFKKWDPSMPTLVGNYFYDFIARNIHSAQEHIELNLPYFKKRQWTQVSVAPPAFRRYMTERKDIRLFMEEIKPHHTPMDIRAQMFESLCKLIDMTGDEHCVTRWKTMTTRKEMMAAPPDTFETANWHLLYNKEKDDEIST